MSPSTLDILSLVSEDYIIRINFEFLNQFWVDILASCSFSNSSFTQSKLRILELRQSPNSLTQNQFKGEGITVCGLVNILASCLDKPRIYSLPLPKGGWRECQYGCGNRTKKELSCEQLFFVPKPARPSNFYRGLLENSWLHRLVKGRISRKGSIYNVKFIIFIQKV